MGSRYETALANSAWVPVSQGLTRFCNVWAGRKDLSVYVGPGGKVPAKFTPSDASIDINSDYGFKGRSGSEVRELRNRKDLAQYPVAGGLAMHESGHARYSPGMDVFNGEFSSSAEKEVFSWLDETRIEGRMVARWPGDRGYLRASAREILLEKETQPSARFAAVLIVGRAEVGSLEDRDVQGVEQWILSQDGWTAGILDEVREIVADNTVLEKHETESMREHARRLHELMPEDPSQGGGGEGESLDLEGLGEAIEAALGRAAREGLIEVLEAADNEAREEAQARREATAAEQRKNKNTAAEIFKPHISSYTPSQLSRKRAPSPEEISASIALSRELENARYREKELIEWDSVTPPGRFNPGEAMRRSAAISVGAAADRYSPFTQSKREDTDEASLVVGMMSDVSGSMRAIQPDVGSTVWMVADAVYRLKDATAAAVYYGDKAYPGLRPGDRPSQVSVWDGGGNYEHFDDGFRALDGALNLLNGSGARVLVVVSDGQYRTEQIIAREKWLDACAHNGVAVVWIALNGIASVKPRSGMEIVSATSGSMDVATAVGKACVKTLKEVSRS